MPLTYCESLKLIEDTPYPDTTAIFSGLGQAFGISATSHAIIDGIPACWQIGDYNPSASYRFPVATLFDAQASRIERAIGQLAARYKNPFFVLLPSASAVTQSVQDVALRNGCKVLAYEDLIEFSNNSIQVRGMAANMLADISAGWIKHIDGAPGETRFPTPAGATWGDICWNSLPTRWSQCPARTKTIGNTARKTSRCAIKTRRSPRRRGRS